MAGSYERFGVAIVASIRRPPRPASVGDGCLSVVDVYVDVDASHAGLRPAALAAAAHPQERHRFRRSTQSGAHFFRL